MVKVWCFTILMVLGMHSKLAKGAEVDQFTDRHISLKDSRLVINKKANQLFLKALKEANDSQKNCHEKTLFKVLKDYFKNHYVGKLTPFIFYSDKIDKRETLIKSSIYREFSWLQAFTLATVGKWTNSAGAPEVNYGGFRIGADKFEHIFGRGLYYYERYYLKKKSLKKVLKYGSLTEKGLLGATTTGVYSFADLMANFNGLRFWNHILLKEDDILGKQFNRGPYVVCQDNKWVQNEPLDFLPYIDHSLDEAQNCSLFRTKSLTKKVKQRIEKLGDLEGKDLTCPIRPLDMKKLEEKYGSLIVEELINTTGHYSLKEADL